MPIPNEQSALERKPTKNIVYDTLRDWIVDGTIKSGEKIIDVEVSNYFSVSRTPVREALQMLSEQNLVKIIPNKGTYVTELNKEETHNVYQALCAIHRSVLTLAFPKITPSIVLNLKNINSKLAKCQQEGNYIEMKACDDAFHSVFLDLANNPYLNDFNEQLKIHSARAENTYFLANTSVSKSAEDHERIIAAIEADDLHLAELCMAENWLRFVRDVL